MHLLAREETGLRCLLQVALGDPAGLPVPIAQIAEREGISTVYAAKLMRRLRLAGLVGSTRGASGGYALARPAERISVWDAIHALDESFLPETPCACQPEDRLDCRRTTGCAVASLWRRLGSEIRRSLEAISLASLCEGAFPRPDHIELPIAPRLDPKKGRAKEPETAPGIAAQTASETASETEKRSLTWSLSS